MALENYFRNAMQQLAPFEAAPQLIVAMSGGADSMALYLLAHQWAAAHDGAVIALIVDHGLRPEAALEAKQVKATITKMGGKAKILPLRLEVESAIQERARDARYAVLVDWAKAHGVRHILLGHHADDQAETVLMRLLRQSQFDGLAGMSAMREQDEVRMLRPLLGIRKQCLLDYLNDQKVGWIEDPSNRNTAFARVRMRQFLSQQSGLCIERLDELISRFARVRMRDALLLKALADEYAKVYEAGFIEMRAIASDCSLTTKALLRAAIETVRGDTKPVRASECDALLQAFLEASEVQRFSYHHTLIERTEDEGWLVYKEPERLPSYAALQCYGKWDRFLYEVGTAHDDSLERYTIGPLGEDGRLYLKERGVSLPPWPHNVIRTLPAIWHLEVLVQVYHMGYVGDDHAPIVKDMRFSPAKPFASDAFCAMT